MAPVVSEYLPAPHSVQLTALTRPTAPSFVYEPAGHGWQVDSFAAPDAYENFPSPHSKHCASWCAPTMPEYFPGGHLTHASRICAPDTWLYVPAGHGRHMLAESTPGSGWYVPTGQGAQVSAVLLPCAVENVPAVQFEHSWPPCDPLYLPGTHCTHSSTPPSGSCSPGLCVPV